MSVTLPPRSALKPTHLPDVSQSQESPPTLASGYRRTDDNKGKRIFWKLLVVAAALLVGLLVWTIIDRLGTPDQPLIYYTVTRDDLPITITARGNLESQTKTEIRCEVDNYGREGYGTAILFIVPNGSPVEKGDLLVEIDSASLVERLDDQVIDTEHATALQIQSDVRYENQKTQNETALAEAKLGVELAELELKMYEDGEDGTFQITLKELELLIQEARTQMKEAQAGRLMEQTNRNGIETLWKLGYRGKGDLDQARYKYLQSEDSLVKSNNALANAISSRRKLELYEYPMRIKELRGSLESNKRNLIQVQRDNKSLLSQAEAAKNAADRSLIKEEQRLEKYRKQFANCKIYAPHEGMAVYASDPYRRTSSVIIGEGALVRRGQRILDLPDLSSMQVKTSVHESVLNQIEPNLQVTIKIDAFPQRYYRGHVESVGIVPDQGGYFSSGIKVYKTIVLIDEEVDQLKPGMSGVVEIHVDRLKDVLSVPVQAIFEIENETWCSVETRHGVERRKVKLGPTNDKFVHILEDDGEHEGLREGERVVLNPMVLVGTARAEREPISPDEDSSEGSTEVPHRVL